jgi:membrane dipeptidase
MLGDSFQERADAGLSRLGAAVVDDMNRLGMLVDLSHCGDRTTREAVARSAAPCLVSHAGCRAVFPSARNKADADIRALADKGGLFSVYAMSLWLTARATPTVGDVLAHILHALDVAGEDHVGFGSDGGLAGTDVAGELAGMQQYAARNPGVPGTESIPGHVRVPALAGPDRMERLATALSRKGVPARVADKLLGGNFVRLFGEVMR